MWSGKVIIKLTRGRGEGGREGGRGRELTVSPGLTVFSPSLPPVMPSPRVGSLVSDTSIWKRKVKEERERQLSICTLYVCSTFFFIASNIQKVDECNVVCESLSVIIFIIKAHLGSYIIICSHLSLRLTYYSSRNLPLIITQSLSPSLPPSPLQGFRTRMLPTVESGPFSIDCLPTTALP